VTKGLIGLVSVAPFGYSHFLEEVLLMNHLPRLLSGTLCLLAFTSTAQAAVFTTFGDRTAFEAAILGATTETFDSYASDTSFNGVAVDVGDFVLNADPIGNRNLIDALPAVPNGTDIDGTTFLNYFLQNTSATITFDTAVTAVGFDISAFGNVGNVSSLSILDGIFDQTDIPGSGGVSFFGVTSDTAFTTLTFFSSINDGFSVDNLTYGEAAAVPVPAGLPLLLGGLGMLGWLRRRST